jgi:opacity protein-like surface antigen
MMRAVTASAFCAAILAGQALAGDLDYYPKAPAGSAYYGPASMVTAQVDIAGGLAFASGDASGAAGVLSGAGRANMQLRGPWNLQVDVYGQSVSMYDFLDANAVNLNHMNFGAGVPHTSGQSHSGSGGPRNTVRGKSMPTVTCRG